MSLKRKSIQRVVKDKMKVSVHWKLEKFDAKSGKEIIEKKLEPYEVKECDQDVLLHEGIIALAYLAFGIGSAKTAYDNSNAYIGVGNDNTAPADTQTGLIGASKEFQPMNASYPQQSGDHDILFQADFEDGEAEFAWNEETIVNANSDSGDNLCRQNTGLGTKPTGQTWRLTGTVTIS